MNCRKAQRVIALGARGEEVDAHLRSCKNCRLLFEKVDGAMALLDKEIPEFDDLTAKILQRKREQVIIPHKPSIISYIAQLAAVIMIGVIIGLVLGRNASPSLFSKERSYKDRSLQEYLESHHLQEKEVFGRF